MAISTPCSCTREDVKGALDFKESARDNALVDAAIEAAARDVEGGAHRVFYPVIATRLFAWPNFQRAYPWRLWLNQNDLISLTAASAGGVAIPLANIFLEPVNSGPPYTWIELDRSKTSAFAAGSTPQRSISLSGQWGYGAATAPAGTLGAAMSDTTGTVAQVSNSAAMGVGDSILIDSERMLVTDRAMITTAQIQQGSGCSTASAADKTLAVTDGAKYAAGEIVLLDSERMKVVDIASNNLTVIRAWDGTALATHSGATIFAPRSLTVTRGALGTTAVTHSNAAPVSVHVNPALIRELATAVAGNYVLQKTSGWSRMVGEGESARPASGQALAFLWADAMRAHGRSARQRVI
jgi:hypothetical protein